MASVNETDFSSKFQSWPLGSWKLRGFIVRFPAKGFRNRHRGTYNCKHQPNTEDDNFALKCVEVGQLRYIIPSQFVVRPSKKPFFFSLLSKRMESNLHSGWRSS